MQAIPIQPMVDSFFADIPQNAKKVLTDRKKQYLSQARILQESYVVYRSESETGICFNFRDYGLRDIRNIAFTLVLETPHHVYKFQCAIASVKYRNDNQFKIHIVDLQRIPISKCYLVFDWILYMDIPSQQVESKTTKITDRFVRPTKLDTEYMRQVDAVREKSEFNKERLSDRKGQFTENALSTAWMVYDEIKDRFQNLLTFTERCKETHGELCLMNEIGSDTDLLPVPISCYFDKGFYSAVYYAQHYPIIEKRLSGGKSAIQCVVGVDKSHLDMLLYLFYCTVDQRKYYQYMTDEQIALQKFLEANHPVMALRKELEQLKEHFPNCDIVLKASPYIEASELVANYFLKLKDARDAAYTQLTQKKQTHGKWVNEYKLFTLARAIFPDAEYQYSADWLDNQVLYIYIPCINCAIEYQGEQHYQPVDYFGGEEKLLLQEEMDKEKREKCRGHEVALLEWPYSVQISMSNLYIFLQRVVPEDSLSYSMIENQIASFPINSLSEFLNNPKCKHIHNPMPKPPRVNTHEIRKYDAAGKYLKSYLSVKDAAENENLSVGGISKVIYGERKTAGGFQWRRSPIESEKNNISPIE